MDWEKIKQEILERDGKPVRINTKNKWSIFCRKFEFKDDDQIVSAIKSEDRLYIEGPIDIVLFLIKSIEES